MKKLIRTCDGCGTIEETFSRALTCASCVIAARTRKFVEEERKYLQEFYTEVEGPFPNKHGQRMWTFVHTCGQKQDWLFANVRIRMNKDTSVIPCTSCGGKRRMSIAMAAYLEKYARTYDLALYTDYSHKVRGLSEKTYNANIDLINPNRHKRGHHTYHLDHIVSIIVCFKAGFSVETAASLPNLRILEAGVNMTKGRRSDDEVFQQLLEVQKLVDTV